MTENGASQGPVTVRLKTTTDEAMAQIDGDDSETVLSTLELVTQTHGFMNRYAELVSENGNLDAVFFLDKSARPIAYLFRKLYQDYVPDLRIPQIRFISVTGNTNLENSFDNPFRFQNNPRVVREAYLPHLKRLDGDNKKILIVDDFEATGRTTRGALYLFDQSFPESQALHMVAYAKKPKWYGYTEQIGVMDYVSRYFFGYGELAAKILSSKVGKHYTMESFCYIKEDHPDRILFESILDSIIGNVPYLRLQGSRSKVNCAREELDHVVDVVKDYKALMETESVKQQ
jgi:hypothetical protein